MKFDDLKKLHQKKYRQEFGYFLAEGEHLVHELEKACDIFPRLRNSEIYVTEQTASVSTQLKKIVITEKQMSQLCETKSPQQVIACVPNNFQQHESIKPTYKAIYLQEIQDPGNLGTILRTAAWFGNFKLLLSPNSVDPFNSKAIRASMGAIFHVEIKEDITLEDVKKDYKKIACLDMSGEPIYSKQFHDCDCYVFGNEARGLDSHLIESLEPTRFTIPGKGVIDSLNLATAVSLSCYELNKFK